MATRASIVAALTVLLWVAGATAASAAPSPALKNPPPTYGVTGPHEFTITMSDGVKLKGDVYWPTNLNSGRPARGRFPVVLAQTPYAKRSAVTTQAYGGGFGGDGFFPYLIERGYINVIVDVRGTGSSGGQFGLFSAREIQDGVELVRWAARVPHSSGRVGTAGSSYLGLNQVFTAGAIGHRSPLKAIFPVTTGNDLYRDLAFGGGIPNVEFAAVWLGLRLGMVADQPDNPGSANPYQNLLRALGLVNLDAQLYSNVELGGAQAYDGSFWQQRNPRRVLQRIVRNGIPAFFWSGWFDVYQRGAPLSYAELQNAWAAQRAYPKRHKHAQAKRHKHAQANRHKHAHSGRHGGRPATAPMLARQPVTGRYQLAMGPWFHNPTGMGLAIQEAQLAWFDRWLKRKRNGIDRTTRPLHAYELGSGRWANARDYPFREARVQRLFLGVGRSGTAPHALNDGTLGTRRATNAGRDEIAWNDARSPCNRGLDQWNTGFGSYIAAMAGLPAIPCSSDDSSTQTGALTYTTAPFRRAVTLAGPVDATLFLRSSAPDAEVVVSLEDVGPSGKAYPLTAGALLGSLRALDLRQSWRDRRGRLVLPYHPYTSTSTRQMRPGQTERLDVEVYPTFARLAPSHRLRLTVTTGDTALQPSVTQMGQLAGGVYEIGRGGRQASYVDVPLASSSSFATSRVSWGACNGGC